MAHEEQHDVYARLAAVTAELEAERRRRAQAEADLRAAEERHRLLAAGAREYAMLLLDPDGRITDWSEGAERLLGYAPDEVCGQPLARLFPPEERQAGAPEADLREAVCRGSHREDRWFVRKDGSRLWGSGVLTAVRDEAGGLRGFVKIFRDLTDRRLAQEELERQVEQRSAELRQAQGKALQAERLAAIGQTVATLAHEARSALQRMQSGAERLAWRLQDNPEALGLVREIDQAVDDLRRLYDDVRGYVAPVRLDYRRCDLAEVWRAAWGRLAEQRAGRDAGLEEQTAGVDLGCEADCFRLEQVFRNLFDNALAACSDPVRLTVACSEAAADAGPALRVAVRDNGPGLSPEQRQRMFEPFYTTKTRGTGLGLAICRRVLEAHGGSIEAGGPGRPGAEIILTLPRRMP